MGMYLSTDSKGNPLPVKGKADALIADGATEITQPIYQPYLVAVVENPVFHAAAFAYSREEFAVFFAEHKRRVRWLIAEEAVRLNFQETTIEEHLKDVNHGQPVPFKRQLTKEERAKQKKRMEAQGFAVIDMDEELDKPNG